MTTPTIDRDALTDRLRVTGVVPPIPTPFRDGRLDLTSLRRMLDALADSVDGVLIGGSTGEAASLTADEREAVIRAVHAHLNGSRTLVVSIADNSIENSRRLATVASECDADLVAASCPNYYPNSGAMLDEYFEELSAFGTADLCLYDNPTASNTTLSAGDIVALVNAVPSLTHIKVTDTSLGKVDQILRAAQVTILAGDDSVLWHHLRSGAGGLMTAIPLVFPELTAKLWDAHASDSPDVAYAIYAELSHFIHCGLSGHDYPAVVKAVLHERGILASPEVRLPLLALAPGRRSEILAAYRTNSH